MIDPLSALSAMSHMQAPVAGAGVPSLPASTTNPISEAFQLSPELQTNLNTAAMQASQAAAPTTPALNLGGSGGPSTWGHMVQQMVMDVNAKQQTAAQKVNDVLQGGPTPVHEAMIATEEASLSFQLVAEMRNKIVESYQNIMQMQV